MEESPFVVGLKWFATAATTIAAFMVSLDVSRRVSGYGFVLFVFGSIAWVAGAVMTADWPLTTTNGVLLCINLFGVYRYLIRKRDG